MRFYNPGDEIYMFGFSRGAYIARFLAEMLDFIGLLSHGNEEMVKFAWKAFAQWQCRAQSTGSDEEVAAANAEKRKMYEFMKGFRETFSRPVGRIKFLGLFDTVNSVPRFETAWMQRSKFPYTARSTAQVIRHAVSIDERRAKFRQDLMYQGNPKSKSHHKHWSHWNPWARGSVSATTNDQEVNGGKQEANGKQKKVEREPESRMSLSAEAPPQGRPSTDRGRDTGRYLNASGQDKPKNQRYNQDSNFAPYRARSASRRRIADWKLPQNKQQKQKQEQGNADSMSMFSGASPSAWEDDGGQDIDEVWFAGGHADVGGGWEMLEDRKSASHVPLAWIVREAMRAGLPFDSEKVTQLGCACSLDWDTDNPAKLNADLKKQKREQRGQRRQTEANIPDIRLQNGADTPESPTFPESPPPDEKIHRHQHDDDDGDDSEDEEERMFHGLMHLAHTSPIHDSLEYGQGLPWTAVTAWKIMEYMPFVRMDLKSNGSWEPIRWPLPRGEVRDVPDNIRVHGSVIRRMKDDVNYRPGNLIVGGGGRGVRKAPSKYGIGEWECVADEGDPIGEIWMRTSKPDEAD